MNQPSKPGLSKSFDSPLLGCRSVASRKRKLGKRRTSVASSRSRSDASWRRRSGLDMHGTADPSCCNKSGIQKRGRCHVIRLSIEKYGFRKWEEFGFRTFWPTEGVQEDRQTWDHSKYNLQGIMSALRYSQLLGILNQPGKESASTTRNQYVLYW